MQIIVGISEVRVSRNPDDLLVTYALGSCIGVTVYDRKRRIGGMGHFMLPQSSNATERAAQNPDMFVDTGFQHLLEQIMADCKNPRDMIIKVAGGANMLESSLREDRFRIGERNFTILRKICWKLGLFIAATEVGGNISRTMEMHIADGRVFLKTAGEKRELGHGISSNDR